MVTVFGARRVEASPVHDDAKTAYIDAAEQLAQLELEAAIATLDAAVERAKAAGAEDDSVLAPLLAMRAGLVWASTNDEALALATLEEAVRRDHNVQLPIELRSVELRSLLERARQRVAAPAEAVVHASPRASVDDDVELAALFGVALSAGASAVLYWRPLGASGPFEMVAMDVFGNLGVATVAAGEHGGRGFEYFFVALGPAKEVLVRRGDEAAPLRLLLEPARDDAVGGPPRPPSRVRASPPRARPRRGDLPRVFLHLGVGTGIGLARGAAEQTGEQLDPGTAGGVYGLTEQACAIERWFSGQEGLAPDDLTFSEHLTALTSRAPASVPGVDRAELVAAYDARACRRRHPVAPGLAVAPLHLAPELGVRVFRGLVLAAFARVQVVTGASVVRNARGKDLARSFAEDVRSPDPRGVASPPIDPRLPFAVGLKLKVLLDLPRSRRWKVVTGVAVGYGFARLRVPMGFSNDRNGNSVPDANEIALHGEQDATGAIIPGTCTAVWPFEAGCDAGPRGDADRSLAREVRANAQGGDPRVDTVLLGPLFAGPLFGVHLQVVRHLALWAELDALVFFPAQTSVLFDLTLGPVVTF